MLDDGNFRAGCVKDVGEFTADGAAADDDQALIRLLGEGFAEEGFRRQIADVFETLDAGDVSPAAGGDENLVALDFLRPCRHLR